MADVLLGYHLTNVEYFSNQYERIRHATSVSRLKKYVRTNCNYTCIVTYCINPSL